MNRREMLRGFLGALCAATMGRAETAQEVQRTTMGIVVYCLGNKRRAMQRGVSNKDLADPRVFLDYCRELGAGGIQTDLRTLDKESALSLRRHAERLGMFIEAIIRPPQTDLDVDRFESEMRTARLAGVRAVRTVIIPGRRYERFKSLDEFRSFERRGREALLRGAKVAERQLVRLAVENHKDQLMDERLALLEHISSEYVGACVDTGNSFALLEDPIEVVEAFAPWAYSVHLKDQAVQEYEDGFLLADVALGDGFLDLKKMVSTLRRVKPDVQFSLETITRDPLRVPCLTDEYWAPFPSMPSERLARTLRTVRANAAERLPQVSTLSLEDQVAFEETTVRKCLAYARSELGLL